MLLKIISAIAALALITSCNSLDGKIETRSGSQVYLVNASKTKQFRFTVKVTKTINDTIKEYSTISEELAPGDEKYLGIVSKITKVEPDFTSFNNAVKAKNEGIIKLPEGAVLINIDSAKKAYTIKEENKYEVTGQLEVKYSPKKDNTSE